jgi:hypothetical protein
MLYSCLQYTSLHYAPFGAASPGGSHSANSSNENKNSDIQLVKTRSFDSNRIIRTFWRFSAAYVCLWFSKQGKCVSSDISACGGTGEWGEGGFEGGGGVGPRFSYSVFEVSITLSIYFKETILSQYVPLFSLLFPQWFGVGNVTRIWNRKYFIRRPQQFWHHIQTLSVAHTPPSCPPLHSDTILLSGSAGNNAAWECANTRHKALILYLSLFINTNHCTIIIIITTLILCNYTLLYIL